MKTRVHHDRSKEPSKEALRRQQNFDSITFSYLKRHYFEPDALQQRTMDEFIRAVRTRRIIAFTGSMTTEDRGYAKWSDFVKRCFEEAHQAFRSYRHEAPDRVDRLSAIVSMFKNPDRKADTRVSFSVIGEAVDLAASYAASNKHVNPNEAIAERLFLSRHRKWAPEGRTVLEMLLHDLNIDRTITLNYDLEAELEYCRRDGPDQRPGDTLNALDALGDFHRDHRTDMLVKRLPGARSMVSDVFNRERTDRLFEFAIGSADHEYHVLHLHGRADAFDSMVVSYRDYDRLYRRSGLSKAPFEHALRLVFAGNPILFVGIGMKEDEVNKTLQEFVGNHPYRRVMPTFLLWNSIEKDERAKDGQPVIDEEACNVFRIDMLHRLGILTLFSHELVDRIDGRPQPELPVRRARENRDKVKLLRLRQAIANLGARIRDSKDRRESPITAWRSMRQRAQVADGPIGTWQLAHTECKDLSPVLAKETFLDRLTLVTARSGSGKGEQAQCLAQTWLEQHPGGTVLMLNADFCFDTDALLNLAAELLKSRKADRLPKHSLSRRQVFRHPGIFTHDGDRPILIITNGVERLFSNDGRPLSAEFDEMIRDFVAALRWGDVSNIGMVAISTPRTRAYFERLFAAEYHTLLNIIDLPPVSPQASYLHLLQTELKLDARTDVATLLVREKDQKSKELSDFRRAFFAAALEPRHLETLPGGEGKSRFILDILTVMAHIGQPVEADVLFHAPRIQRRLRFRFGTHRSALSKKRKLFSEVLDWLVKRKLILELKPFYARIGASPEMPRFGLHATLLTELRERSGVPLSEAVLSTAFNMSLYTAQPADGPLPEPALHDELGRLIDWMIGAYKDAPLNPDMATTEDASPFVRADAVAALRAALAIIRGFFSTTTLLSLDAKARSSDPERDGALTEHAERLERLVAAFQRCAQALKKTEPANFDVCGPLYADELVWLYNEIGVVKLAQGSLYEARFAFDEAERINRQYVEFDDRSHNWRRITLNQIFVDIERARLDSAERLIKQIEEGFDPAQSAELKRMARANASSHLETAESVSSEDALAAALIRGYRGISAHISGRLLDAHDYFEEAISILRPLDERRALATFHRHLAALFRDLGDETLVEKELGRAIAMAESVRQMDLVHHGRIHRASIAYGTKDIDAWARSSQQLHEALVFSDATDMYRVRVEARANLALASMMSGDFEVALEHATDAMTVAVRHGLSLRKVSLRVLLGRILVKRGDRQSGEALIDSAMGAASRIGYQGVVSRAQAALLASRRI